MTLGALVAGALLAIAACASEAMDTGYDVRAIRVSPRSVVLPPNGTQRFTAVVDGGPSDGLPVPVTWSAQGGTIDGEGLFVAGASDGAYRVYATHATLLWLSDSSTAVISSTARSVVASVAAWPDSASLSPYETLQLTAVARDSAGDGLPGRTFTWATSNGAVASVSGTGMVTALAAGVAAITAASEGMADTTTIVVEPATPPPPPPPATEPWYELTFEKYASTQELLADKGSGATFTNEDSSPSKIELVNDAPPGLGLTKSMRFRYDDANPDGVMTVGRNVNLPGRASEIWVEVYLKWSDNFSTKGGTAPYDHKILFGRVSAEIGRWDIKVGANSGNDVTVGYPGNSEINVSNTTETEYWIDQWVRLRFHWKFGTSNDAILRFWRNETLVYSNTTFSTAASSTIYGLALGRNQDNRNVSNLPMYLTWGRTRVWNTDPGW